MPKNRPPPPPPFLLLSTEPSPYFKSRSFYFSSLPPSLPFKRGIEGVESGGGLSPKASRNSKKVREEEEERYRGYFRLLRKEAGYNSLQVQADSLRLGRGQRGKGVTHSVLVRREERVLGFVLNFFGRTRVGFLQ